MEENGQKFTELLRYVGFIKDEKVKIQRYISGIPLFYGDRLKFDEPKNLEVEMRMVEKLYEQNKNKSMVQKAWDNKKNGFMKQSKKGFKPSHFKKDHSLNNNHLNI